MQGLGVAWEAQKQTGASQEPYRCMVGLLGGSPWLRYGVVGVAGGKPGVMGRVPPMLLSVSLCQALSSRL